MQATLRFIARCAVALLAAVTVVAAAQDFPSKPIRLILPSSPGNVADLVARTLATPMGKALGQPVVIENIAGAGGVIGTERVARAPRDGYTLGLVSNNHVINPSVIRNIPFDSVKDMSVVSVVARRRWCLWRIRRWRRATCANCWRWPERIREPSTTAHPATAPCFTSQACSS